MNKTILTVVGVILGVIVVAVVGVLAMASMQPDAVHVERSATMAATPADIHPFMSDFDKFVTWSPWTEMDPDATREISDPSSGVGARYAWSGSGDVGTGSLTITKADPLLIVQSLEFTEPFVSKADVSMIFEPEGDTTKVTWTMDQDADMMFKVMTTLGVIDMDAMLGPDYEKGLATLKGKAEAAAAARIAAEEAAKAEAERLAMEAAAAEEGMAEGEAAGGPE